MRILPAIIIGIGVLLAPAVWIGLKWMLSEEDFQGASVDATARIEIEMLRQQIEDLRAHLHIKRADCLIQNNDVRPDDQRPRDGDALALST